MSLLPEWAPHIHPLIIHFPIALLFAAVLIDLLAVAIRKVQSLHTAAVTLYTLGTLAVVAAFLSGRDAADTLDIPTMAQTVLNTHADWAEWTLWFFGVFAVIRIGTAFFNRENRMAISVPLLLIGTGGLFLVYETAEHGAQMVFEHGVGVQAAQGHEAMAFEPVVAEDDTSGQAPSGGPMLGANGSWSWTPDVASLDALPGILTWVEGNPEAVTFSLVGDPGRPAPLAITTQGGGVLFTLGEPLESIQADVDFNADGFNGRVTLVHHVQDARNYQFLTLEQGMLRLGRMNNGTPEIMDSTPHDVTGWISLRAVGDRGHFRGYHEGALLVHGHGEAPAPGTVGLRLEGTGTLRLGRLEAVSLR